MVRVSKTVRRPEDAPVDLASEIERMSNLGVAQLRDLWRERRGGEPTGLSKDLLLRCLCHDLQERRLGELPKQIKRLLLQTGRKGAAPAPRIKIGSILVREYLGKVHEVIVAPDGFSWQGETYASLSMVAHKITGVVWSGPRFFGLPSHSGKGDRT